MSECHLHKTGKCGLLWAMKAGRKQKTAPPEPVRRAFDAVGGPGRLGELLGLTRAAPYYWTRVPAERVLRVEELTGVPRHELRPDLYPAD